MTDLPTELAAEIARVTAMKDRFSSKGGFGLTISLMKFELDAARVAIASGDTAAMVAALTFLKGYGE